MTKTQINRINETIRNLEAERDNEETRKLGPAAVACVQQTIDMWRAQLDR